MASSHKLVDPTSPQSSYGTSVGTSSPVTPASPETPKPKPDQSDFEKIEVIPEKKEDAKKTTATTLSTDQSQQSKPDKRVECHNFCISSCIFTFAVVGLIIRITLYKYGEHLFEVITICISVMVCCVLCCFVKRGHFAKKWDDFPPEFQRKARGVYDKTPSPQPVRFDNPMEPRGSQKQPLHRLKYEADVHRAAEVESSSEASGLSQGQRKDSSGSDKRLTSSDDSKTDNERKEARAPVPLDVDVKTKSSSPTARVLNLLKRRKS